MMNVIAELRLQIGLVVSRFGTRKAECGLFISSAHILSLLNMQHLSIREQDNSHNLFLLLILFSGF